jgi:hypothetical protein
LNRLHRLRSRPYGASWVPEPPVLIGAAAVVLVAAIAGWALANQLTAEPAAVPAATPANVPVGTAQVTLRSGWSPVKQGPRLAGLEPPGTRAFRPSDGGGGRLVISPLKGEGTELPAETVAALRVPPGNARKAKVGGLTGAGYTGLAVRGVDGLADVYVVPTPGGPIAVTCVAPVADPLPAGTCPDDVVSVSTARTAPNPAAKLLEEAPALLRALDRRRVSGRRALRRAHTPAAQARQARRLATAYAKAATRAERLAPASGPTSALPRALSGAARAYSKLAASATRHDRAAWRRARQRVNAAEKAVAAQLAAARSS